MKDERRNYVSVGAFVLAMLAALVVWIALLSGRTGSTDTYHAHYSHVLNLSPGTQVHFQGFPVGRVESIGPASTGPNDGFRVDLVVEEGWPIPEDSLAVITSGGVLSAFIIDIEAGTSETLLRPGDQIPSEEPESVFAALSSAAERISAGVSGLQPFLEKVNQDGPVILENIRAFTVELEHTAVQLNEVLGPDNVSAARNTLENLEGASEAVGRLSQSAERTVEDVDRVVIDLRALLAKEEGELGHALVDLHDSLEAIARHIDAIARNLETTTRNLSEFSQQIREHPNVLLTGREDDDGGAP